MIISTVTSTGRHNPAKNPSVSSATGRESMGAASAQVSQRADSQRLSAGGTSTLPDIDWQAFADELAARLGSNVTISAATLDSEALYQYAATAKEGLHLILSQEFLQNMVSSETAYSQGKALLTQLVDQLQQQALQQPGKAHGVYTDGLTATFWTSQQTEEESPPSPWTYESESEQRLLDMMQEAFRRGKENSAKFKIKLSPSIYQSRVDAMARLARARTVPETRSAAALARRSISSLKMALSLSDDKEKDKIRATIMGLEKIVTRSARKIRDLDAEALLRRRREKAEQEQLRRRAQQAMDELRRRKTARHSREYGQLKLEQDELWLQRLRDAHGDLATDTAIPVTGAAPVAPAPVVPASSPAIGAVVTLAPPVEIVV